MFSQFNEYSIKRKFADCSHKWLKDLKSECFVHSEEDADQNY